MAERIHDDEPDVGESVVRALLETECPHWANAPLEYLATSGTDNAMWRVRLEGEPDVVVRLPRRPNAAAGVGREVGVLEALSQASLAGVRTPVVRHVGSPHDTFAHPWSVLEWIDGVDAWSARRQLDEPAELRMAGDLGEAVLAIGALEGLNAPRRRPGSRGGPLGDLLDRLDRWLTDPTWHADHLLDVRRVRRIADAAREVADHTVDTAVVHGDLIPGNLLTFDGRLSAIIDWGGVGSGDPAQDVAPAWAVFGNTARAAFREVVDADESAWVRGRAFELEHAVGGVLYYAPRRHPLGDVMARTLGRILEDPAT